MTLRVVPLDLDEANAAVLTMEGGLRDDARRITEADLITGRGMTTEEFDRRLRGAVEISIGAARERQRWIRERFGDRRLPPANVCDGVRRNR